MSTVLQPIHMFIVFHLAKPGCAVLPGLEQDAQLNLTPNRAGVVECAEWPSFDDDPVFAGDVFVKVLVNHPFDLPFRNYS